MRVREATSEDAVRVAAVYNDYIETNFTLETEQVTPELMAERIEAAKDKYNWLLAEVDGEIIGFAYYKKFRQNIAYNHTVESTIYLEKKYHGKGYGKNLYQALIDDAAAKGYREMIGGVLIPNVPSVKLHERVGFRKVAHFEQISIKAGKYIDVAFWQRTLH